MRGHNLPEARLYADMMLTELRKVVPSFLRRVDIADRGGRWTEYLAEREGETVELVDEYFGALDPQDAQEVVLTDFDPDGEDKLLAAICYSSSHLP